MSGLSLQPFSFKTAQNEAKERMAKDDDSDHKNEVPELSVEDDRSD